MTWGPWGGGDIPDTEVSGSFFVGAAVTITGLSGPFWTDIDGPAQVGRCFHGSNDPPSSLDLTDLTTYVTSPVTNSTFFGNFLLRANGRESCCGNGTCDPGETPVGCPADCNVFAIPVATAHGVAALNPLHHA